MIIKAIGRYFSINLCITDFILTTHCQQHTKYVSPGKAVSAISVGLKYETRDNCYYHLQRDSLIVSIMEDILSQSMMSVRVSGGGCTFLSLYTSALLLDHASQNMWDHCL